MNSVNSRNDLCYDDSTINMSRVIIIIIIIIIITFLKEIKTKNLEELEVWIVDSNETLVQQNCVIALQSHGQPLSLIIIIIIIIIINVYAKVISVNYLYT